MIMLKKLYCFLLLGIFIIGSTACTSLKGEYYLKMARYDEGEKQIRQALAEAPEDPSANYYLGRLLLAQDKPEKALPLFKKAIKLKNDDDDYHFWLGITYWAIMDYKNERKCYLKALSLNPRSTYAHLYLGHNYLDNKEWKNAHDQYKLVLKRDKYDPEALYNISAALGGLKKSKEEHKALLTYLKYYPDGQLALKAVDRLNAIGDFSWRNSYIGKRRVSFISVKFKKGTAQIISESRPSLQLLGSMLKNSPKLRVNIVVYAKGKTSLAKQRALAVKKYILGYIPDVEKQQLILSWFGTSEKVRAGKRALYLPESVQFITHINN
ncbi:tetratricopeptide repeat protein [Halodesulfovibrio spirochaetisodalis]|nr:tetratricopeptide repeat protein [Halodesulfovibrio spirochaetisodalis]